MLLDAMDSYPEGYIPCNCHPETCNHRDGMVFVGTQKPLTIRGNTIEYWKQKAEEDYIKTPISVLKYITILEELQQLKK
jgi:hypothetical protein